MQIKKLSLSLGFRVTVEKVLVILEGGLVCNSLMSMGLGFQEQKTKRRPVPGTGVPC